MNMAAPDWIESHIVHGLVSGEGLIWEVRDEIRKREAIKERGRTVDYHEVISDAGVLDKRLLVLETEFASCLKVINREGNTLSPTIRSAWDIGNLQTLAKNSPARATGAHISIIGHITTDELRRCLTTTEASNGFANRYLFCCVERSKLLPEGGNLSDDELAPLADRVKQALESARHVERMMRDETTRQLWRAVYPELSHGAPGLLGAVTSRSEAQVVRLSCIYALLDESVVVRRPHLEAALAVWGYAEDSARCIWGAATGDPIADEIVAVLNQRPDGITRTDMSRLFGGHRAKSSIQVALQLLETHRLAHKTVQDTGGRPVEKWSAGPAEGATK
jgi:hypothetical protein